MAEASEEGRIAHSTNSHYFRHRCSFCVKILRGAVQLNCGCRSCERCAEESITVEGRLYCPVCMKYLKKDEEDYFYFQDIRIRKEIKYLYRIPSSDESLGCERTEDGSSSVKVAAKLSPVGNLSTEMIQASFLQKSKEPHVAGNQRKSNGKLDDFPGGQTRCLQEVTSSKERSIQQESVKKSLGNHDACPMAAKKAAHQERCSLSHCGECYAEVLSINLADHRNSCWKLHLYNGRSFWCDPDVAVESSLHQSFPGSTHSLMARTMGGLVGGFHQLRDVYGCIQDEVMKLRWDMEKIFNHQNSIDDPIFKTMKWKVENVSRRIADKTSLLSRSFYSSMSGYNMCLKIVFHSETFMLHLVLLCGENDHNLKWPFRQRVILSVLGKTSADVYEAPPIRPDLQHCRNSHGTLICSLGFPRSLRPFIIDNCLFVRCSVI